MPKEPMPIEFHRLANALRWTLRRLEVDGETTEAENHRTVEVLSKAMHEAGLAVKCGPWCANCGLCALKPA